MAFVAITIEGGLFPADFLDRLAATPEALKGQQAADFGVNIGRLSGPIQSAFSDARTYWQALQHRLARGKESPTTLTRDVFVLPLLESLDYTLEYQRLAVQAGGASYALSHRAGVGEDAPPIHIVGVNQALDERGTAQRSPHALLQNLLNRTDALWGVVTNGKHVRLLRDTARLTRPTYLEVDLQAMIEGNLYAEFVVFYRLLHRSRFPEGGADADKCLLEHYYQQGIEEGGRVRERLRVCVERALEGLGTGFLAHPHNTELRQAFGARLDPAGFYRQLLRLVYRLLFLMVAEERKLLLTSQPETAARQEIYTRWYSIARLRDRAETSRFDDPYDDLWEGLKQTFRLFSDGDKAAQLGLSPLNGELFGTTACHDFGTLDARQPGAARRHVRAVHLRGHGRRQEETRRPPAGELRRPRRRGVRLGLRVATRLPPARHPRSAVLRAGRRQRAEDHRQLLHAAGPRAGADQECAGAGDRGAACRGAANGHWRVASGGRSR